MKKLFNIDSNLKELFLINLMYANPMVASNLAKKEKYKLKPNLIYRDLMLRSYLLGSVIILVIYSLFFSIIPFNIVPFMLDYSVAILFLLAILQTFSIYYYVFFDSKDVESYMALPIKEVDLFKAKMGVVTFAMHQFILPIGIAIALFFYKMQYSIALSLLYGIIYFFLFLFMAVLLNILFIQFLAKKAVLSKLKNKLIGTITVVAALGNVAVFLGIQFFMKDFTKHLKTSTIVKFGPLSLIMNSNIGNLLLIAVIFILIFLAYNLIIKKISNNFYRYIQILQSGSREIKKENKNSNKKVKVQEKNLSFKREFFDYNKSLVFDNNLFAQYVILPNIFLIILFGPQIANFKTFQSSAFIFQIVIGMAVMLAVFHNFFSAALPTIIISLDRYNYEYLLSLPINRKSYFIQKALFASILSSIIPTIIFLGICIFFKVGILTTILGVTTFVFLSILISIQWVIYDYNNVMPNWQNVVELSSRVSKAFVIVMIILFAIVMGVSVGIFTFLTSMGLTYVINWILGFLIIFIIVVCSYRINKFLKKISK